MISTDLFIPSRNQSLDDDDRDRSLSLCVAAESSLDDEWFSKLHSEYVAYPWAQWKCSVTSRFADCHKSKCQKRDGHKAKTNFFNAQQKGKGDFISHLLTKTCIVEHHYFTKRQCRERLYTLAPFMSEKREAQSLPHAFSVTSWCKSISERTH